MRLARDTDREIVTTMRGKRYTTSIEGTLTGLGGNLVIIDDPLKQDDAHSEAVRTRTIEWYRSTLLSRPDDKQTARIVLVMQRVHQDDLAGYLEEQGGFEILNLPAIATDGPKATTSAAGAPICVNRARSCTRRMNLPRCCSNSNAKWGRSPFRRSTSRARFRPAARSSSGSG